MTTAPDAAAPTPPPRRIYTNRTLNLRSIRAIGYDMDYTLVHYRVEEWERRAYERLRDKLAAHGWPVAEFRFDPAMAIRGLVVDTELGNLVKANRFGYVKRAFHGTRPLSFAEQRRLYARTIVDLDEPRWVFLNTFFSLSEGSMYAQLVDLLDEGGLPAGTGYSQLFRKVRVLLDEAHMEGELKAEIAAAPERFVIVDEEAPVALLDQRRAGKRLMLITNSEWAYTRSIMAWAFDRFLPRGVAWRDLFDVIIVSARKPDFFLARGPLFEVASEDGLLRPARSLKPGGVFLGGDAVQVEAQLGLNGDQILYVGDHLYSDVHVSKSVLRWRTALIVRELEDELAALESFAPQQARLDELMAEKESIERRLCLRQLAALRAAEGRDDRSSTDGGEETEGGLAGLRASLSAIDDRIAPLSREAAELGNPRWGLIMRTGNDKSYFVRQLERYADVYTSRVANFLVATPFASLRSPRGSMPHDLPAAAPATRVAPTVEDAGVTALPHAELDPPGP